MLRHERHPLPLFARPGHISIHLRDAGDWGGWCWGGTLAADAVAQARALGNFGTTIAALETAIT